MQRETKDVEGTKKFPFSLYIVGHMQIEDLQEIISKGIQEVGFTDIYLIDVKIKDNKIIAGSFVFFKRNRTFHETRLMMKKEVLVRIIFLTYPLPVSEVL